MAGNFVVVSLLKQLYDECLRRQISDIPEYTKCISSLGVLPRDISVKKVGKTHSHKSSFC